ncbi:MULTISPECIES: hypothetical protein [unclassified Marinovum]
MADRLEQALAVAQAEADEERDRILAATRGHSDEEAQQIWEEERSIWLQYLEDEVRVAETKLLLREIRKYHLPIPEPMDTRSWHQSKISDGRYLSQDAERFLQRTLLEERRAAREDARREADQKRAKIGTWFAFLGLFLAFFALLQDIPIGEFVIDVIKELKAEAAID